ncbi:unnamed protein product [Pieris macdunnoughi]|uniref:Uncharacterized protein n=1 Tax=Pieris macdunnoughi TaxID=345717 RepID=A0A821VE07_9NEOP|nr:unnamed protein product [Pieris macdunnoughi]
MSEMGLENVFYLESELIYLCKGAEGWCCLETLPGYWALSRRQINNISIRQDGVMQNICLHSFNCFILIVCMFL